MKHNIYEIVENKTGLGYGGASEDIEKRFDSHINRQRYDKRKKNRPLYVAMNAYGSNTAIREGFTLNILEECNCQDFIPGSNMSKCHTEEKWIAKKDYTNPEKGFNISRDGSGQFEKGQSGSPETQFKKGSVPTNKKTTPEQDQEIVEKWKKGQSINALAREYDIDWKGIRSRIRKIS